MPAVTGPARVATIPAITPAANAPRIAPVRQPRFQVLQSRRDPAQRALFLPPRPVTR